ncbi:MAG: hypothetical protein FJX03_07800 [Alphaproteobacteria bacterium]|nr:hypothetical protein [Alphaproteobacteria bacterium]
MKIKFNINLLFAVCVTFIFTYKTKSIETEKVEQPFTTATLTRTELLDTPPLTQVPQESLFRTELNLSGTLVGFAKAISLQESYERDLKVVLAESERTAQLEADTRKALEHSAELYEREKKDQRKMEIDDQLQVLRDLRKFYWDEESDLSRQLRNLHIEKYEAILRPEKGRDAKAIDEERVRLEKLLTDNRAHCKFVWDQITALDAQWMEILMQRLYTPIGSIPRVSNILETEELPTELSQASQSKDKL